MDETQRLITKYGLSRNGHSIYAPSSASMWLHCPGSLLANAVAVDDAGEEAAYGTVAHDVAQRWLKSGRPPSDMIGKSFPVVNGDATYYITVDPQMIAMVERYIEWCRELPGDHFYEHHVDLSDYTPIPNQGGTADCAVCQPGRLTITDLKTGRGVRVFVENNEQAMLYALGFFNEWDFIYGFEEIVIRICQPPHDYFGVWACSREQLLAFGEFVRERALLAWHENAPRNPSTKSCRFCRVKLTCPAMSMLLEDLADDSFSVVPDYDVEAMAQHEFGVMAFGGVKPEVTSALKLSTEALAFRLRFRKLYESWFKAIYEELLRRAQNGERVPGWKIVSGRREYKWKSPDVAAEVLEAQGLDESDYRPPVLVSVARARELLRGLKIKPAAINKLLSDDVIETGYAASSLVRADDDERPDVQDAVDDVFTVSDDDDL